MTFLKSSVSLLKDSKLFSLSQSSQVFSKNIQRNYPGLARHFDWGGDWRKQLDSHEHLVFTPEEARMKALSIYRRTLEILPLLRRNYNVPLSLESMRLIVRNDFENNKHVHHIAGKEALLRRAHILLYEAATVQLMGSHVLNYFSHGSYEYGKLSDQQRIIEENIKQANQSLFSSQREQFRQGIDTHQLVQYVASKFDELDLSHLSRDREKAFHDIIQLLNNKLPEFNVYGLLDKGLESEIKYKMERFLKH